VPISSATIVSEGAETSGDPLDPRLQRLIDAGADDEGAVLHGILERGVDQGWFCRPNDGEMVAATMPELESFYELISSRPQVALKQDDPWEAEDPPVIEIEGQEPGWIVVTQRCDLVRSYCQEPLVELARGRLVTDTGEARAARLNSPRLIAVADGPKKSAWAADLRQRALLPKDVLLQQELFQPVRNSRARKALRLRLGQRYWRDPVPSHLVETLQRPLIQALSKSKSRAATAENFEALLGEQLDDGTVLVMAIVASGKSRDDAESDWNEVIEILGNTNPEALRVIEPIESGVYSRIDLSLDQWLSMFKFDLDEVTYGKKASDKQAEPNS
jgi:hypothetical protein